MVKCFAYSLLIMVLLSCSQNNKEEFQIPENTNISDAQLISPFFIEQLMDKPLNQIPGWNDSLIAALNISQVKLSLKSESTEQEKNKFCFRRNGELYCYCYTDKPLIEDSKQEILYHRDKATNSIKFKVAGADHNKDQYVMLNRDNGIDHVRKRKTGTIDSLQLYGTVQRPELIIRKSGNYVLSVDFILLEDEALSSIKSICSKFNIDFESLKNADLSITYTNRKYQPLTKYQVTSEGTQKNLLANWEYSSGKLLSYSRFINGNLIKQFDFSYGKNKLLNEFVFNQVKYSVNYK